MARKGENIYKRKDGRWEGRCRTGRLSGGKAGYISVYGKSYREVKEKLLQKGRAAGRKKSWRKAACRDNSEGSRGFMDGGTQRRMEGIHPGDLPFDCGKTYFTRTRDNSGGGAGWGAV